MLYPPPSTCIRLHTYATATAAEATSCEEPHICAKLWARPHNHNKRIRAHGAKLVPSMGLQTPPPPPLQVAVLEGHNTTLSLLPSGGEQQMQETNTTFEGHFFPNPRPHCHWHPMSGSCDLLELPRSTSNRVVDPLVQMTLRETAPKSCNSTELDPWK